MDFGNLELLFLFGLVIVAVFFFSRCSMKCKCKSSNGGDTYTFPTSYDDEYDDYDDSAYSLPYAGGEILRNVWTPGFGGGKVIGEGTYADTGLGTF
uniref:Uncharacterized protein n=1 Tax=Marseillevirus LCMAC101 TaxID=2506602 RepID=A0A481YR94_9VIRU|nr:MAG: hypothetical protein LCMAC101_03880 [Marseillevirus LCMAC101]